MLNTFTRVSPAAKHAETAGLLLRKLGVAAPTCSGDSSGPAIATAAPGSASQGETQSKCCTHLLRRQLWRQRGHHGNVFRRELQGRGLRHRTHHYAQSNGDSLGTLATCAGGNCIGCNGAVGSAHLSAAAANCRPTEAPPCARRWIRQHCVHSTTIRRWPRTCGRRVSGGKPAGGSPSSSAGRGVSRGSLR